MCIEVRSKYYLFSRSFFTLLLRQALTESTAYYLTRLPGLEQQTGSMCLYFPVQALQEHNTMVPFYIDVRNLNSGLLAHTACALPFKSTLWHLLIFYIRFFQAWYFHESKLVLDISWEACKYIRSMFCLQLRI